MVLSKRMLERATRECITSPQIAMTRPSSRPLLRRMVRGVEQGLRRMFVGAIAGIDSRAVDLAR